VRRLLSPSISPSRRSPTPKIPSCPLWRTQARMIFPMRRSEKVLARLRPGRPSLKSWWQPDLWNARARAWSPQKPVSTLSRSCRSRWPLPCWQRNGNRNWRRLQGAALTRIPSWAVSAWWFKRSCPPIPAFPRTAKSCLPRRRKWLAPAPAAASRSMRERKTLRVRIGPAVSSSGKMTASGRAARRSWQRRWRRSCWKRAVPMSRECGLKRSRPLMTLRWSWMTRAASTSISSWNFRKERKVSMAEN
jgi:DNA topoisomerase